MARKDTFCLEHRVDTLANALLQTVGENPIFFIDTGAAIDFERTDVKECKLKDSKATIRQFYELLEARVRPIYVSEHVYNEMKFHCDCHKINGLPEISKEHLERLNTYNRNYCEFLKTISGNGISLDESERHVREASVISLEKNPKKSVRDPISENDIGLMTTALWALHTTIPYGSVKGKQRKISSSTIISPDKHILLTVGVLSKDFYGRGLRAVHNREVQNGR